jgi:hypothetical protein
MATSTMTVEQDRSERLATAALAVTAAFGTYFCMYAFRKPFTAASFDGGRIWGLEEKTVLVTAQVLGYMLSKFIGIRVVAELPPRRRAAGILILVAVAEAALVLFALAPAPLHVACLFLNGLPLGMVFGLVLGCVEGRRNTEALAAGLCASFILADGVTKTAGTWVLRLGSSERWMPAIVGALFLAPLLCFVALLRRIPPPGTDDVAHRSERAPMTRDERASFLRRYGVGLTLLVIPFLAVTIIRSIRADFAPEIFRGLGVAVDPWTFTLSESFVALGVLLVNGLSVLIVDNRRAFFTALGVSLGGTLLMALTLLGLRQSWLGGFAFMILMGLGLYLPYVATHTTIFERLIAMTRERGNLGFLMYVADSIGYLGYVAVMLGKGFLPARESFVRFFVFSGWIGTGVCLACLVMGQFYWARRSAAKPAAIGLGDALAGQPFSSAEEVTCP